MSTNLTISPKLLVGLFLLLGGLFFTRNQVQADPNYGFCDEREDQSEECLDCQTACIEQCGYGEDSNDQGSECVDSCIDECLLPTNTPTPSPTATPTDKPVGGRSDPAATSKPGPAAHHTSLGYNLTCDSDQFEATFDVLNNGSAVEGMPVKLIYGSQSFSNNTNKDGRVATFFSFIPNATLSAQVQQPYSNQQTAVTQLENCPPTTFADTGVFKDNLMNGLAITGSILILMGSVLYGLKIPNQDE